MKIALIIMFLLAILGNVASVGKERKPLTAENAALNVLVNLLFLMGVIRFL